jgi:hypothetical protein
MKQTTSAIRTVATATALAAALLTPRTTLAHCDTVDGPVVQDARAALATGNVAPVLKWVRASDEPEIRAAFAHALAVRALGAEARELADTFFFETLVRVHRASEGMPYTGLKPAGTPLEPGVAIANESLVKGSVDAVVTEVTEHVTSELRARFARVAEAKKHASQNADAGRRFVAAYVAYVHFVEGLLTVGSAEHDASAAPAPHHHAR